jgi:hypothetical protein
MRRSFINESARLVNPAHEHLRVASLGVLWTNERFYKGGKEILATAEIPSFKGSHWQKARQQLQVEEWFHQVPDFIITISSWFAREADNASFLAVIEHELLHCGQAKDEYGNLKFRESNGMPIFFLRMHDVEEFVDVVERYGAPAAGESVVRMVAAARKRPTIARARINGVCGTCLRLAA